MSFLGAVGVLGIAIFGPTFSPPAPTVYEVVLSPDFTPRQDNAVIGAEQSWMVAIPGSLIFHSSVGVCDATNPLAAEGRLVCIYPVSSDEMLQATGDPGSIGVTWRVYDHPWRILLDVDLLRTSDMVQRVAAHEMGHAMGLHHSKREHTLMVPYLQRCTEEGQCAIVQSLIPTAEDVSMWWHVRRSAW